MKLKQFFCALLISGLMSASAASHHTHASEHDAFQSHLAHQQHVAYQQHLARQQHLAHQNEFVALHHGVHSDLSES